MSSGHFSGILQQRIELDKECMFQYTQLRKEVRLMDGQTSVAPVLMRFQRGCQQVGLPWPANSLIASPALMRFPKKRLEISLFT